MTANMLLATGEHLLLGAIVPAARPHQKTRRQKKEITYAHPLEHSGSAEEVESDRKQGNGEHNEHQDGNDPPGRQHPRRCQRHHHRNGSVIVTFDSFAVVWVGKEEHDPQDERSSRCQESDPSTRLYHVV